MGLMQAIQRGKQPMPPRLMVYGTEGIGKSTLAANAPKPIFVQTEDGLNEIACEKFPLAASVDDVLAALTELGAEQHDYQTVVIDSLDWLERLIWDAVCREFRVSSIEKADGGYQRGYVHALTHWRRVVDALNALRVGKGLAVILIAHAKVEKFEDPEATTYDR
ncbi:MAG TPA: ATP-binding protein, partial [Planctomycetota bacterium]|nr:ATP-binding protein [Planctomycetota bacterium]